MPACGLICGGNTAMEKGKSIVIGASAWAAHHKRVSKVTGDEICLKPVDIFITPIFKKSVAILRCCQNIVDRSHWLPFLQQQNVRHIRCWRTDSKPDSLA